MPRLALLILLLLPGCGSPPSALIVSAAASLENVLAPLADTYSHRHPRTKIEFNFGGSGVLARQIEDGAPVDVFLSASPEPMNRLGARGLLLDATRRDLLRGEIVLIVPRSSAGTESFDALAGPHVKFIALADPAGEVRAVVEGRCISHTLRVTGAHPRPGTGRYGKGDCRSIADWADRARMPVRDWYGRVGDRA